MTVSTVVVTRNQHDLLRQCLRSIVAAMEQVGGEVLVVDNASTDATARVLAEEFPSVSVIQNKTNVHYTRAMNQGIRATTGRYVFLLNDDTMLEPDCLHKLSSFMDSHPRCGGAGPMLVSPEGEYQISAQKFPTPFREIMMLSGIAWRLRGRKWSARIQPRYPEPMGTQIVDWVCGGAIFLRRSILEELGCHDENYLFYRDDPDIGMRLKSAGWEVWYLPDARVVHYHGMSTVKTTSKVRFDLIGVRSRRHYHRKFHGLLGSFAVECAYGLLAALKLFKSLLLGRLSQAGKYWHEIRLLFAACAMPIEERDAIEGYRHAAYNGMDHTTFAQNVGGEAAPVASRTKPIEQGTVS